MRRWILTAATLVPAALALGCSAGPSAVFKEAFVLYRSPMEPKGTQVVYIGFVNETHARYVQDGNVVPGMLRGTKTLPDDETGSVLDDLAALGYPERWTAVGTLGAGLAMAPRDDLLLVELDGQVHVFVRGPPGGGAETVRHLRRFTESKMVVLDIAGGRSGFRVIQNPQGAGLFEKQIEDLTRRKKEDGR